MRYLFVLVALLPTVLSCKDANTPAPESQVKVTFGEKINLTQLEGYANQAKPAYITQDNTNMNPITDAGATLGRVLFYDVKLSVDDNISCAHCHKQEFAFSDTAIASSGVNGFTNRHSMRLVNSRFATEQRFFWDERAINLEVQTLNPIQDHKEMGFSGANGDPSLDDLVTKLQAIGYYQELFTFVYGDSKVNPERIQKALAQFVRSIQSFDSKYDVGRAMVPNNQAPFPNFTPLENQGKQLFMAPPVFDPNGVRTGGGVGCQGCHRSPEFDIDPNSRNNGITGTIGSATPDFNVTRSPSLRNLLRPDGSLVTPAMHTAALTTLDAVLEHYNNIPNPPNNTNLDPRLRPAGQPQKLQLTQPEKDALIAFLKTLSGTAVYTDPKWSSPFP